MKSICLKVIFDFIYFILFWSANFNSICSGQYPALTFYRDLSSKTSVVLCYNNWKIAWLILRPELKGGFSDVCYNSYYFKIEKKR